MNEPTESVPVSEEIESFFASLGLKYVPDIGAAIAQLPQSFQSVFRNAERSSRSVDELLPFVYQHAETIAVVVGHDLDNVAAVASLLTALPPLTNGATVLDVGGGPGHLALWMSRCWPSARITVLDPLASSVNLDWTPELVRSEVRFVSGAVPTNLTAVAGQRFDRVVVARTLAQAYGHGDARVFCRRAIKAIRPLIVNGGDLVVIDHFHDRDDQLTESIAASARKYGFSDVVRGWRLGEHLPWQLRFVAE